MSEALLAEFKFMAVNDGPGIRTTLFLKGCPLSCLWCHNPECIGGSPQLIYRGTRCVNCGRCVPACPRHAHSLDASERHLFDRVKCVNCGRCEEACPHKALQLCGKPIKAGEAAKVMLEDEVFFRASGGGVTVSGGEPLLYPDFCTELFELVGRKNIHRALDTSGAVPWEAFAKVLPETDLVLYDIKHIDDEQHKAYTGGGNLQILENLKRLGETGMPIEIRIPVIPGINTEEKQVKRTGTFLSGIRNIIRVRLLPYHPFAAEKYRFLGLYPSLPEAQAPSHAELESLAKTLKAFGLNVFLD